MGIKATEESEPEMTLAYRSSGAGPHVKGKLRDALHCTTIRRSRSTCLARNGCPAYCRPITESGVVKRAVLYADLYPENWQKAPGALEWLDRECTAAAAGAH